MADRVPGKYERACFARHEADLALSRGPKGHPKGFRFDPALGAHVISFVEGFCKHHKGEWAGKPLTLEPWQQHLLSIAFGWLKPELGGDGEPTGEWIRRFTILYIEIPRKNGKTELAAALGLYLFVADGEPGAEIYASATKKDQAKILWDTAAAMVKASPDLKRFIKVQRNNLSCAEIGSKFEPLGADSNTLDGLNPHGNLVDELHAHRDRGVWDVLDTAMGARRQPLTIAITTAGVYAPESIGWIQHDHAVKVLDGTLEDDGFFAFIAAADSDADWAKPETWATANPNLGVSVKPAYLAQQIEKAKAQPSFRNTVLQLHLNIWTQQRDSWIPIEAWNACDATPLDLADCQGRTAYLGMDLASKVDIAALVAALPREGKAFDLVCRFYCPEDRIVERSRKDRVPYDAWVRDGWMTATPGNVIDYEFIRADVNALGKMLDVREIAFDPWNATQLATQLQGDGFVMVETRQGFKSLSEPAKALETLVMSKKIHHGGHPVLRWMVSNVSARRDANDNIAPDKSTSPEKIDGVVAAIMALGRAIVQPEHQGSVYETRDLLVL